MARERLEEQRATWRQKAVLRALYTDYFRQIVAACETGRTLEIGGGGGGLRDFLPDVICTDIVPVPWLDCAADARRLPFPDASFANVVAVDVFHHIEFPIRFLIEAVRALRPGGRLILLEPAITPGSVLFYRYLHPEPVDLGVDPFVEGAPDPQRQPFDANQALASLVFVRMRNRLDQAVPGLFLRECRYLSLLAYPLSGGYRRWSFIPAVMVPWLLRIESRLAPVLGRWLGFRLFIVLEKRRHMTPGQGHDPGA